MSEALYVIRRTTLEDIANAVRTVTKITGSIPVKELAKALRGEPITTTTELATAEAYAIEKQTLVDIADAVRSLDGTTDGIVVKNLAARILSCNPTPKLPTPEIWLDTDEYSTSAILGEAILGYAILGVEPDEPEILKLATPVIELVEPDEPEILKLATPVIELVEPDEPEILKLATPEIRLIDVTDDAVKVTFDNYGYIDFNGNIINEAGSGKKYSDIVAIADLANGEDGYCVQDFDTYEEYPKVLFFSGDKLADFIQGFTRTQIGDKDILTVAEINALAPAGATHVAFNSDYEDEQAEDCVYIKNGSPTYKPIKHTALDTPVIYLRDDEPPIEKLATPTVELVRGYEWLTFIQGTGTQYIDTGFNPNQDTRVVAQLQCTEFLGGYVWIFGARTTSTTECYGLRVPRNNCYDTLYGDGTPVGFSGMSDTELLNIDMNKNVHTINSTTLSKSASTTFQTDYSIVLFGLNNGGSISKSKNIKFYSFSIYDNGVLVRHLVPCINPNKEVGMYDTVTKQFFGNAGTGEFLYG